MKRGAGGEQGYALLAALLIAAIALLATATLVAAVLSTTSIATDDAAAARASDAADAGVADALDRLRWGWLRLDVSSLPAGLGPIAYAGGSYSVSVAALSAADLPPHLDPSSPVSADDPGVAACRIDATGVWGTARRVVHVVVLSTPDGLPRGLVVGGDAMLAAPTLLRGCGLCSGGDVSGREWLTVAAWATPTDGQQSPDLAYGGLYAQAAVHATGRIFAHGVEEHAGGDAPAADSDADSGGGTAGRSRRPLPVRRASASSPRGPPIRRPRWARSGSTSRCSTVPRPPRSARLRCRPADVSTSSTRPPRHSTCSAVGRRRPRRVRRRSSYSVTVSPPAGRAAWRRRCWAALWSSRARSPSRRHSASRVACMPGVSSCGRRLPSSFAPCPARRRRPVRRTCTPRRGASDRGAACGTDAAAPPPVHPGRGLHADLYPKAPCGLCRQPA